MSVAREITKQMSLRRSLSYTGISRNMWYYSKKPKNIPVDPVVSKAVQKIGTARPTYGTRRMAAAAKGTANSNKSQTDSPNIP